LYFFLAHRHTGIPLKKKKNKKKEREFVDLEEEFLKKRNIYFYTIALKKWRVIFLSFLKKKKPSSEEEL
jgi:hypothetical protein